MAWQAQGNIRGPQGAQGVQGAQGPAGSAADIAAQIHAATAQPNSADGWADGDEFAVADAGNGFSLRKVTWAQIKTRVRGWLLGQANTWAGVQTFSAGIQAGESSPSIKFKKLTGSTSTGQGGGVNLAHGLDPTKIVGWTVNVAFDANSRISQSHLSGAGYQYDCYLAGNVFALYNASSNSSNILNKPFVVLVFYEAQ